MPTRGKIPTRMLVTNDGDGSFGTIWDIGPLLAKHSDLLAVCVFSAIGFAVFLAFATSNDWTAMVC